MNSRNRIIYSLAVLLLAGGCVVMRERRTAHIEHHWPAASIRHIEVREVDGEINIEGGSGNDISMNATVQSRISPKMDLPNQGYFTSEVEGDTLIIGRRSERHGFHFFFHNNETRVDYDLRVPSSVALDLHTVNGRIETHGVDGETRAVTVNGKVKIDTPGSSEVEAHTVNGGIEARFGKSFQGATLKTVNGGVIAALPLSASFTGDFSQVNGDIEAAFPLNIHSRRGSRRVSGEVNGGRYELRITTVNGDIKIDTATPPPATPVPAAPPAAPAAPAVSAPPIT
jgi:hypothetical protein